jgi:hypothetical protein
MPDRLKVAFDDPEHGWVVLTLSRGSESVTIIASYTPSDSFLDLANALYNLFQYSGEAQVVWHSGSTEYELCFAREGEVVRLEAYEYSSHLRGDGRGERFFEAHGSYRDVCLPFWRALRDLQGRFSAEELNARWHRPFPTKEIAGLTPLLREGP